MPLAFLSSSIQDIFRQEASLEYNVVVLAQKALQVFSYNVIRRMCFRRPFDSCDTIYIPIFFW